MKLSLEMNGPHRTAVSKEPVYANWPQSLKDGQVTPGCVTCLFLFKNSLNRFFQEKAHVGKNWTPSQCLITVILINLYGFASS